MTEHAVSEIADLQSLPMTERVAALRVRLAPFAGVLEGTTAPAVPRPPYAEDEPFHRGWMAHADAPYFVRLAHAQAEWRGAVRPVLTPGHLIVGTLPPPAVIWYATGVFGWDFVLDTVLAAEHPETAEIVEYWQAWLAERPRPDVLPAMNDGSLGEVLWSVGIGAHSTQDYGLALSGGLDGLREGIRNARPAHLEAADWYDALEIALDGVSRYILAHARAAEQAALTATGAQAEEWRQIAANCRHIASRPPETFHQAIQLFYFLFMLNGHDSPGRMDQYLWPALQRELAAGTLTLEAAQELVDSLYLKLAEHVCYGATLGGQLPEGGDAANTLSWLSLNSIRRLRLLSPRTAYRWHREAPEEFFTAVVHSIATGATFPTLVNDEAMIPSLRRRGLREEHARDYTFCGCGQTIPSGRAYGGYEDLIINAAKPLLLALHGGRDERSGKPIGAATAPVEELTTFAALEEAVWAHYRCLLEIGIEALNAARRWGAEQAPDFVRSLVTHSCVERGRDWRAGGADYHEGMVDVVGLTTLADSLTVIKRVVYDERRLSLREFVEILDRDWAGAEALWAECRHRIPKFGNEDAEADGMVVRWLSRINDWLFTQRTAFGGPWGMDIIGWSGSVIFGEMTGATPDGRHAGEPLADSAGPAQGRDTCGITATLNSMVKLPMDRVHGPLALNLRISGSAVETPDGEAKLAALLKNYLERGGQHAQVTIAGADEMRAAQQDPAAHRDLIVRVGGFSAYFVAMERRFQDDMIRRTEHGL
ncbi:MAG: pyruvate formate lyase family protein [Armatimonadota bacterium]